MSLSSSCHHFVLSGLIIGVGLSLNVGAPGFGALSGVLVKLGGGAFVLVGAGPFGGLGKEKVLLSFSNVAFRSGAKFAMLSVTAHRISSK